MVTVQLICSIVFTYAKSKFSHAMAQIVLNMFKKLLEVFAPPLGTWDMLFFS